MEDERPHVYVYAPYAEDDVRVFYEIPAVLAEAIRDGQDRSLQECLADLVRLPDDTC